MPFKNRLNVFLWCWSHMTLKDQRTHQQKNGDIRYMWTRLYSAFAVKWNVHFRFPIRLLWTDPETGSCCLALVSYFRLFLPSLVQLSLSMNYAADRAKLGLKDEARIGLRVETTDSWTGDLSFVFTFMCRREAKFTLNRRENRKHKCFFQPFCCCLMEVPEILSVVNWNVVVWTCLKWTKWKRFLFS